jgi:ribosomal protein L28
MQSKKLLEAHNYKQFTCNLQQKKYFKLVENCKYHILIAYKSLHSLAKNALLTCMNGRDFLKNKLDQNRITKIQKNRITKIRVYPGRSMTGL